MIADESTDGARSQMDVLNDSAWDQLDAAKT